MPGFSHDAGPGSAAGSCIAGGGGWPSGSSGPPKMNRARRPDRAGVRTGVTVGGRLSAAGLSACTPGRQALANPKIFCTTRKNFSRQGLTASRSGSVGSYQKDASD
jgi:hypothetical protein